jgi:hypothetical protein
MNFQRGFIDEVCGKMLRPEDSTRSFLHVRFFSACSFVSVVARGPSMGGVVCVVQYG